MADRPDLAIQPFEDGSQRAGPSGEGAGALITLPNGLQITEEEQQKRIKDAEELEEKLKYITEKVPTRIMQARRREQFRLMRMEEQAKEEEAQKELEEKRQRLQAADEARTAKRRAQREKKKNKKKRARTAEKAADGAPAAPGGAEKSSDSEGQADLD